MRLVYTFIFTLAFAIDRISKFAALRYLVDGDRSIGLGFNLTLSYNRGVSFGLFHSSDILSFYAITFVVLIALVLFGFYMLAEVRSGRSVIAEVLVLSGGISNMLDRFMYGGVVDFIDFYVGTWHWYTFNLADLFVVGGVLFIVLRSIKDVYLGKS